MRIYFILLLSVLFLSCKSNGQHNNTTNESALDYKSGIDQCMNEMESMGVRFMPSPTCMNGHSLPIFELKTIDGEIVSNKTIKGKVTVINFWFIGCPPCEAEIPGFQTLVKKYKELGVNFIAVGKNDESELNDFLEINPWDFQHVNDPNNDILLNTFQMYWGYPTTFIIDKNGVIQDAITGGPTDASAPEVLTNKLTPILDNLLK